MTPSEFIWWLKGLLEINDFDENTLPEIKDKINIVITELKSKTHYSFDCTLSTGLLMSSGSSPVYYNYTPTTTFTSLKSSTVT